MKKLFFVCSGNTCRSPLAEGIAKQIFPESLLENIEIASAGTSAAEGLPASELAIAVAGEHAIDLTEHRSRRVDAALAKEADLIVALTRHHREIIGTIEPSSLQYTYVLSDFCGGVPGDVIDPIGSGLEVYRETFNTIRECVEAMADRMDRFNGWKQ